MYKIELCPPPHALIQNSWHELRLQGYIHLYTSHMAQGGILAGHSESSIFFFFPLRAPGSLALFIPRIHLYWKHDSQDFKSWNLKSCLGKLLVMDQIFTAAISSPLLWPMAHFSSSYITAIFTSTYTPRAIIFPSISICDVIPILATLHLFKYPSRWYSTDTWTDFRYGWSLGGPNYYSVLLLFFYVLFCYYGLLIYYYFLKICNIFKINKHKMNIIN